MAQNKPFKTSESWGSNAERRVLFCQSCGLEIVLLNAEIELARFGGIYCGDCGEPLGEEINVEDD